MLVYKSYAMHVIECYQPGTVHPGFNKSADLLGAAAKILPFSNSHVSTLRWYKQRKNVWYKQKGQFGIPVYHLSSLLVANGC